MDPTPAAKLESTTTAPAWKVAFLSFSTSSKSSISILIALNTLFKNKKFYLVGLP